jgi:hypothetical protein
VRCTACRWVHAVPRADRPGPTATGIAQIARRGAPVTRTRDAPKRGGSDDAVDPVPLCADGPIEILLPTGVTLRVDAGGRARAAPGAGRFDGPMIALAPGVRVFIVAACCRDAPNSTVQVNRGSLAVVQANYSLGAIRCRIPSISS